MLEPIPGHDNWKTMSPPDVEYDPQPGDPCVCGHEYREHRGASEDCWECPKEDLKCGWFRADWKRMEAEAEAREEACYD